MIEFLGFSTTSLCPKIDEMDIYFISAVAAR